MERDSFLALSFAFMACTIAALTTSTFDISKTSFIYEGTAAGQETCLLIGAELA